ncbi:hypothetical protein H2248_006223 [Termitomyces sp. 'cryptogamus']|nr:hypothetical protein H2248_006223 [Termitomyces sp. 'cryptogamus']
MPFKVRTTLYSLALALGFFQNIITIFTAVSDGFAPYMHIFAGIGAGWALLTWVWTSVLLSYNNRPFSSHGLVRSFTHFVSFVILTIGWFGLAIMLGTQFPLQCDFKRDSDGLAPVVWCPLGGTSFGISILLCISCFGAATVVYLAAIRTSAGLSINVAYADKLDSSA